MTLKLIKKVKRDGIENRNDYAQAVQVHAMAKWLIKLGAKPEKVCEFLDRENGGFMSWDWLFEEET